MHVVSTLFLSLIYTTGMIYHRIDIPLRRRLHQLFSTGGSPPLTAATIASSEPATCRLAVLTRHAVYGLHGPFESSTPESQWMSSNT